MKLTKREQKLIIFLGIVVFIFVYYQFVLNPQMNRIHQLKEQIATLGGKVDYKKVKIKSYEKVEKDYKIANIKNNYATKRFFPFIKQEKSITILNDMIDKTGLEVSNIAFSKTEISEIEKREQEKEEENYPLRTLVTSYYKKNSNSDKKEKVEEQAENKEQVEKMSVNISFTSEYDTMMSFIKEIESFDKKLLIKNVTLASNDENLMTGNIMLDFYALPKFHIEDEEYFKWDHEAEYGRKDPFIPFDGYEYPTDDIMQNNKKEEGSTNTNKILKKRYDFYIGVHPITADIPSIIIGQANDPQAKTYVYADNPNIENVEFQLLKKDNKYYYKYKTQQENYPQNYENSMIEFEPNEKEVILFIVSSKRKDDNDNSGINLSITNNSDLQLKVRVEHDDPNRPRVIIKKEGKVITN
ncbi:hypothetical protein IZY60_03715 [Lutibacter sp. B2]|nr:hypothetical protein [Lutibacter sp. B2]